MSNLEYLYVKLANLLRQEGNLEEAEIYCHKLIDLNSGNVVAMNILAIIYQKQDKLEEAERLLLNAITIQPYNVHNYNELGQVYVKLYTNSKLRSYKYKAFSAFIKGVKTGKNNVPLRTEFARFLLNHCNRILLAERIFKLNIDEDPRHFHSYAELGKLYQRIESFEKA